jgi:hypothetical protein
MRFFNPLNGLNRYALGINFFKRFINILKENTLKIFEALRRDHDKQRALLKLILDTHGATATRKEYFLQLKDALELHAKAEERYFYAPLIKSDNTIGLSRHGIAEHHEIDELIAELENTDMSSPGWIATFKSLSHKVSHHLAEEENSFFQQAGKTLNEKQKEELAALYVDEMATC